MNSDDHITYYEGEAEVEEQARADDDHEWELGLVGLLLVVGTVLVVVPEPSTSLLGIALVTAGGVAWVVNAWSGGHEAD